MLCGGDAPSLYGFASHSRLDALLEATVLALIAMMLVDGAVAITATGVREIPSDASFEEALASFAGELSVVLPGALVSADDTLDVQLLRIGMRRLMVHLMLLLLLLKMMMMMMVRMHVTGGSAAAAAAAVAAAAAAGVWKRRCCGAVKVVVGGRVVVVMTGTRFDSRRGTDVVLLVGGGGSGGE